MITLLWNLLRRSRPTIGWRQALLALALALCPAIAATDSRLALPAGLFFWSGLLGLLLGLRAGRSTDSLGRPTAAGSAPANIRPSESQHSIRSLLSALRLLFWLVLTLGIAALLTIAAGQALPPLGLITQDIAAWLNWALAALRGRAEIGDMPPGRVWDYLASSLPRFWQSLIAAPNDGERGARLLVATCGAVATWIGALLLGWGLARRQSVLAWGVPILAALMWTAILGGGTGTMLMIGLVLLLVLATVAGFGRRELLWDSRGTDYSDELGNDVLAWGGVIATGLIGVALLLPTSLNNPLADLLWRDVELPSGIAELEKNIPRNQPPPKVDIGISRLPALELGQSLEQQPPEAVALRIRLDQPFRPSPWPRYWRARVFNIYNGRGWTTNARIGAFDAAPPVEGVLPGGVIQDVEDLRLNRSILVGLPDVFNISVAVTAERLPDGALAAVTAPEGPQRYRILSRPQELASPPRPDAQPPDMSTYLALPRFYASRVTDLAHVLAGNEPTQYEKALAIEAYLRDLPYSYEVRPLPSDGDAVEQFLFDMRQGYCTYYASSMAVLARSLGIPARVAIGYATGEYDAASRSYVVREADAHAWPELYIGDQWLPFEPTPIRPLPARSSTSTAPVPEPAPAPAEQPSDARGPLIWLAVLAIVALLTGAGIWLGRARPRPTRALALEVQRRLERLGVRAGVPWPTGATLNEYGQLLEPKTGSDTPALHDVVDLVGQARYSGQPLGSDEESRLLLAAERVWLRLSRRG
ncbi:MAG TPA: transglutaminaseTgpA domain-containing protein [Roseiflexaceae bacterium]|nr:transglutaminaseTgpA domain-containing protein [Roseiflexaceae bacterium]